MPYANNYSRRSREDFISNSSRSGPTWMPPEPLPPWDRKGEFFRERRNGYGYETGHNHHHHHHISHIGGGGGGGGSGGGGRWRDSSSSPFASGSRNSSEFSPRWGFPSDFRRPPGHMKQGGWHLYQEEDSPHGYSTPRSGDRFMDDNGSRPSGPRGDSRYGRFNRDNRNGFCQKDWRGHSWENNRQYSGPANTPARSNSMNSQKSVGESPARPSNPNQENTLGRSNSMNSQKSVGKSTAHPSNPDPGPVLSAQLHSKDQADRTVDANGSGASQKIGKENSLGSLDWKPLKWSRSGSLISRGSGLSHSSSSKSTGEESNDVMGELAPKNATPVQSPSGDVAACEVSTVPPEETSSRKKPRLCWGEGLAKYEKKKVDGPEEIANKLEITTSGGNVEPTHSASALVDKSPKTAGLSECSSPATPSSFACSSSPGLEKTYGKTTDVYPNNFSVSSMPVSENQPEGVQFSLEKLELNSIANLSSLLSQLLQVDDQCSMDSGFMRSSAFSKLLLWKGDISKTLELTETEIDSLENELKSLKPNSCRDAKDSHFDYLNGFTRPLPLEVISAKDMIVENSLPTHNVRGARTESKVEEIDSPGTATSKFVEPLSAQKPVSPSGCKNSCSSEIGFGKSSKIIPGNLLTCDNEEITGDCKKEDSISDIILASNKDTAANASKVLIRLLPSDDNVNDMGAVKISCLPADTSIKEKFSRQKRFLKFKERVLSLKYRAFHHHWKEDLRLLSSTTHRMKPQKKLDLISKGIQISSQKHRPSIRSRFVSSAGNSSLVPTTEILIYTKKLLSDSEVKIYRSCLKMPSMILDEKEKMSSRFVSSNGLVEDPCAIEKEKALINPWTNEEKKIFMEKLSTFGKDFRKIASFLDHKTIADCVLFYYKNHKSECFAKTKTLDVKKQAKPLSSDTYMLTSGKKWSREMNSASLDVLGEASVIASQADQATKTSKSFSGKLSNRKPRRLDTVIETSNDSNNAEDERETVAADVLAGICVSLSSEPMSSCITSSVKRPSTPDVTQNVSDDDGTCSDESCGEMDPVDWTDDEKSLFVRAFSSHGKDFLMISRFVRTKTREQCKVFFSKARKCLSLETIHPGSNDTNGGGSDVEDACIVETASVGCSDKSDSRMGEDLPNVIQDVSNPDSTVVDLSTSERNYGPVQLDCKDTDMEPEVLCPSHNLVDVQDNRSGESDGDTSKARAAIDYTRCTTEGMDPEPVPEVSNRELVSACENKDPLVWNALTDHTGSQDGQCKQSSHRVRSLTDEGVSADMTFSPLDVSIKQDRNGDMTHKLGYESKVRPFQEHYFRKCSRVASHNAVTELPPLHRSEVKANGHAMFSSSVDMEKPCSSGGDVKLFGQILSKPTSVKAANHHLTPVAECDNNGLVGLENVPVRNYGIWDGSKIKVVSYPPSTNASLALLAKYPSAFTNGLTSEQQMVQIPVNSGECNLNNACSFSPREYSTGNLSVVDHPVFRNQDGTSPFILDFKQKQNVLPCTVISDPVVVLRSQYSSQRYEGGGGGSGGGQVVREELWGGQRDVGR